MAKKKAKHQRPAFLDDLPDEITVEQLLSLNEKEFLELLEIVEKKKLAKLKAKT